MACSCCESGRCCQGGGCSSKKKATCVQGGGEFSASGTCVELACITPTCSYPCAVIDYCACKQRGGTLQSQSSCDCNVLAAAGVANGGCCPSKCQVCSGDPGSCTSTCGTSRECCDGVCCPEDKKCQKSGTAPGECVDKCAAGKTLCKTGSGAFAYQCCEPTSKCCGSQGCKSKSKTVTISVDSTANDWTDTGLDVEYSATATQISITATGNAQWTAGRNDGTPDGIAEGSGCIQGNASINVKDGICHFALIGRWGDNGTPFLVGSSFSSGSAVDTGRLYLRINDKNTGDNSGSFSVTITALVDPCPGATLLSVDEPVIVSAQPPSGPGVELKSLLKLAGIEASPTCSCNTRARQMDEWGEFACLKRLPEITVWLGEEAKKRDLWFFAPAGVALILLAISLAALKRLWKGINR